MVNRRQRTLSPSSEKANPCLQRGVMLFRFTAMSALPAILV